jgi:hypothetical protein
MATEDLQSSMTITEGLAETKTLNARMDKKRQAIANNLVRDARLKDPMTDDGGQVEYVRAERQSIDDLGKRLVNIRTSIQFKNQTTFLTVLGETKSVAEWLTWRKEVAPAYKTFLSSIAQAISRARKDPVVTRDNLRVTDKPQGETGEVIVNLNEKELNEQIEHVEHVLGDLDGKLSLINATTVISL